MSTQQTPSLYPTAQAPSNTRPSADSPTSPASSRSEALPPDYELLLQIDATVTELSASTSASASHSLSASPASSSATVLSPPIVGDLRIIQGPVPPPPQPAAPAASNQQKQQQAQQHEQSDAGYDALDPFFHAFVAINHLNLPLLPACVAARPFPDVFTLAVPTRAFVLRPNPRTEPELVDALERLLRWFCRWDPTVHPDDASAAAAAVAAAAVAAADSAAAAASAPATTTAATAATAATAVTAAAQQQQQQHQFAPEGLQQPSGKKSTADRIAAAGDYGVQLVERVGDAIHRKLTTELDARRERAVAERAAADAAASTAEDANGDVDATDASRRGSRGQRQRSGDLPVGGRVTTGLLGATRKVVGVGASAAAAVSEHVSTAIGNKLASNAVSRNMQRSPEGSLKRGLYDNLMAGMVAAGRVYVAADAKGRLIIEDVGDRGAEITRAKYGDDAASATRSVAGIALDGYRISRFPAKLGASAIVRGAVKSQFAKAGTGADVTAAQQAPQQAQQQAPQHQQTPQLM